MHSPARKGSAHALFPALLFLLSFLFNTEQAAAGTRAALVIGNSEYRSERLSDLPNAARDAAAVSLSLQSLGFAVLEARNASAARMRALLAAAEAAEPTEALVVFYAGHAIEIGGETLLLPVDSPDPTSAEALTAGALRLSGVLERFGNPGRATIIFLDACRKGPGAAGSGPPHALGDNMVLAFASQPGQEAFDGAGTNSPFSHALLQAFEVSGLSLTALLHRVERETARLTLSRQTPWWRSTLRRAFVFRAPRAAVPRGG